MPATTPQEALDSRYPDCRFVVFIDGIATDTIAYSGQHAVTQETATARLEIDLSDGRPEHIIANAAVEVQAGWDSIVGTIFSGRIPQWEGALSTSGAILTVRPVGWSSLLTYPFRFDTVWEGPISPRDIFLWLCETRGVPAYRAADVTAPDGVTAIEFGGNAYIDDGTVTLPSERDPLAWLNGMVEPFGYRIFDVPSGEVVLQRVSGLPVNAAVVNFVEGTNIASVRQGYDISGIVNYPDVHGPTYEDAIGASIPIRAFPASLDTDNLIPVNGGVTYRKITNSALVTDTLAEAVMDRYLIDYSEPQTPFSWEAIGLPGVAPGDTVAVTSPTVLGSTSVDIVDVLLSHLPRAMWLMETDFTVSERDGFRGSYRGGAGSGSKLAVGDNRTEVLLQPTPIHLGDEHLPRYASPSPNGNISATEHSWTLTIPDRASAVNIVGYVHGSNSQFIDGANADLTISKFELWRPGDTERPESSGNLPVVDENFTARFIYDPTAAVTFEDGSSLDPIGHYYWTPFAISLSGTGPGTVTIKLVAGENRDLPADTKMDDFEVDAVYAHIYGNAEPSNLPSQKEPS